MAPLGTEMVALPYEGDGQGSCGGPPPIEGGTGVGTRGTLTGSLGFTVTARGRKRTTPGSLVTDTDADGTGAVTIDATLVKAAGEEQEG